MDQNEKNILIEVYRLRFNKGFTTLCDTFMEKLKEVQRDLVEKNDPDEIIITHSQWKALNMLYSMLITAPDEAKQTYEDTYRIPIEEAL
jgi:hypothetical protein